MGHVIGKILLKHFLHDTALSSAHFPKTASCLAQMLETFQMGLEQIWISDSGRDYLSLDNWTTQLKCRQLTTQRLLTRHCWVNALSLVWIEFQIDCSLSTASLLVVRTELLERLKLLGGKKQLARESLLVRFWLELSRWKDAAFDVSTFWQSHEAALSRPKTGGLRGAP